MTDKYRFCISDHPRKAFPLSLYCGIGLLSVVFSGSNEWWYGRFKVRTSGVDGPDVPVNRLVLCGGFQCRGMSRSLSLSIAARIRRSVSHSTYGPTDWKADDCLRIPEYGYRNFPSRRIDFEIVGCPRACMFPHNAFQADL